MTIFIYVKWDPVTRISDGKRPPEDLNVDGRKKIISVQRCTMVMRRLNLFGSA